MPLPHTASVPATGALPEQMHFSSHDTPWSPDALRALALTVEEPSPGDFRWCILEKRDGQAYAQILRSAVGAAAYDAALATGYGELQRLAGADLEHGPRQSAAADTAFLAHAFSSLPAQPEHLP
jgi:hypothetical protein